MTISTSTINALSSISTTKTTEEIIAEQIQEMVEEAQEQMESMIEAMTDAQEEEGLQVDGISSGFAEPEPSEKEYQDQTAVDADIDSIDDLHDLSMSVLRPEIVAKFVGCAGHDSHSGEGIGSYKFKDLLEANILRDQLTDDVYKKIYDKISENEPDILDKASSRVEELFEKIESEVSALSSYRAMINEALSSLDLQECGSEVGALIIENVQEMLQDEDIPVEKLPSDLESLIMQSMNSVKSTDTGFSNTKLYFSILSSIYASMTGYGPHMDRSNNPGKPFDIKLRPRYKYSSSLLKRYQESQTNTWTNSVIHRGSRAIIKSVRRGSTMELQQLICCLSNELIISGGINRLRGTELGNKYGVTTDDPFSTVFGIDMGTQYTSSIDIPSLDPKKGSLVDFVTIEDTNSNRVVLPFELNDVTIRSNHYLAGSKYLVEGPARKVDKSFTNPLEVFMENFQGEVNSSSAYFNEIMGLSESTLLAPQGLFIRILEDIQKLCLEGSKTNDTIDRNVIKSAVKVSYAAPGRLNDPYGPVRAYFEDAGEIMYLLDSILSEEEQPDYRLAVNETISKSIGTKIYATYRTRQAFEKVVTSEWRNQVTPNSISFYSMLSKVKVPIGTESSAMYVIDQEGEINNVHKMIMTVTDEILAEADSFASRGGTEASYKNDEGFTQFSNLDYSAVLSIVYYLYHLLIDDLFHWKGFRVTGGTGVMQRQIELLTEKNKRSSDALTAILSTYKEGGEFEDLFDDEQNSLAVEGLASTTKIGKNLTMGKVIDIVEGLKSHRSLLKCNVSALAGITTNISQKSTPLTQFQQEASEVFTGKTKIENVKNKTLSSFVELVNLPIGKDALRGLTSMQANNTMMSLMRMSPASELEKRQKRFVASPGQIEAIRVFSESRDFRTYEGIVCVGLPNGMIDNLRMSTVNETERKNESSDLGKLSIRFSRDNELYSSLEFTDVEVSFDSSLYLAPDAYDGVQTDEQEEDSESKTKNPDPVRDMINKVVFTRMESGNVIEQKTGEELLEDGNQQTFEILKNHVYSDLMRMSIDFATGVDIVETDLKKYEDLNAAHISSEGLSFMETIAKSKKVNMLSSSPSLIRSTMSSVEIDEKTKFYELRTGYSGQLSFRRIGKHDVTDIKRAGQSTLYTAELDRHRILGTSTFDRIFYVPISSNRFRLDYREGDYQEKIRFRYGRLSSRNFDLSGYVCDVRVS